MRIFKYKQARQTRYRTSEVHQTIHSNCSGDGAVASFKATVKGSLELYGSKSRLYQSLNRAAQNRVPDLSGSESGIGVSLIMTSYIANCKVKYEWVDRKILCGNHPYCITNNCYHSANTQDDFFFNITICFAVNWSLDLLEYQYISSSI